MTNAANFRTKDQNREIHMLLGKLRIPTDVKCDLARQFTNGRCTSTADMRIYEANNLITYLRKLERDMGLQRKQEPEQDTPENRMRRKMFAIAHEMNWRKDGKVDRERLFAWVEKYGYLHKNLNKYTAAELPRLITQFENVLKGYHTHDQGQI